MCISRILGDSHVNQRLRLSRLDSGSAWDLLSQKFLGDVLDCSYLSIEPYALGNEDASTLRQLSLNLRETNGSSSSPG